MFIIKQLIMTLGAEGVPVGEQGDTATDGRLHAVQRQRQLLLGRQDCLRVPSHRGSYQGYQHQNL